MENNPLVQITNRDGVAVVSSRDVAENFGKEHKHVLENIRKLAAENSATKTMFTETTYDNRGRKYSEYLMNRDGFSLLVMGFTGKEALQWKLKYIEAFNKMEETIKQNFGGFLIPKTYPEALRLAADLQEKNELLEIKIEQDKPLVDFANSVGVSETSITINVMSKLLAQNGVNIGSHRLHAWLRDKGYLIKSGEDKNMPTQKAIDAGLFEIKEKPRSDYYGRTIINKKALVTGKGQMHIVKKIKKGIANSIQNAIYKEVLNQKAVQKPILH